MKKLTLIDLNHVSGGACICSSPETLVDATQENCQVVCCVGRGFQSWEYQVGGPRTQEEIDSGASMLMSTIVTSRGPCHQDGTDIRVLTGLSIK